MIWHVCRVGRSHEDPKKKEKFSVGGLGADHRESLHLVRHVQAQQYTVLFHEVVQC
jgi:hypothetical protein